jgi:hypothetical protein
VRSSIERMQIVAGAQTEGEPMTSPTTS